MFRGQITELLGAGRIGQLWASLALPPIFACVLCGGRGDARTEDSAAVVYSRSAITGGGSNSDYACGGWRPDTFELVTGHIASLCGGGDLLTDVAATSAHRDGAFLKVRTGASR